MGTLLLAKTNQYYAIIIHFLPICHKYTYIFRKHNKICGACMIASLFNESCGHSRHNATEGCRPEQNNINPGLAKITLKFLIESVCRVKKYHKPSKSQNTAATQCVVIPEENPTNPGSSPDANHTHQDFRRQAVHKERVPVSPH